MFKQIPVLFLLFVAAAINADDIQPLFRLKTAAMVTDFVVENDKIYIGNEKGMVEVFDLRTQARLDRIVLEPVRSGTGELMAARIQSVDSRDGTLLIVSSGENAYRNVWKYDEHGLINVIGTSKKLLIKEARFVDKDRIVMGTFASEIILHDLNEKYEAYSIQQTQSTLGDIALNEDHSKLVMSDESGEVRLIDVKSGKTDAVVGSENVDNVYAVAYAAGVIITAGQDRRVAVYRKGANPYHLKSDFLVYAVGISPDGRTGIFSSGEDSDLQLFDTASGRKLDRLVGHKALVNKIVFFRDRYVISAGNENEVLFWKLKR